MAHPALASNDPMKAVARGTSQRLLRAALEATLLVLVAPVAPAAQPPTPTVWFAPLDPMFRPWAGYGGSIEGARPFFVMGTDAFHPRKRPALFTSHFSNA